MLTIILLACTSLGCILAGFLWLATRRPANYPPGPKWLPLIGNTRELRMTSKQLNGHHMVYEKWMLDHDSPILGLKLGSEYVVVVLNYSLVRAVHTNSDFDGRPDNFFFRLRTMGQRLGITFTDGDFWNEQRSFVTRHLREAGYARKPMDLQVGQELAELVNVISKQGSQPVWPGAFMPPSVLNVLWSLTAGTNIERNDPRLTRLLNLMQQRSKAFDMSGGLLNQMAWIRHIAPKWSGFNLIKRFNQEMFAFFMETIDEHKQNLDDDQVADDLIYAYLKEMQEQQTSNSNTTFSELQLIMIIVDLFIAGAQTTSITIDLALMTLATYPEIQRRCHEELRTNLTDPPQYADRGRLPYTEAVLLEVQRFYHIVPLAGPRRTLCETTLGGYTIPENTTILTGMRRVHMDVDHWGDPETFRPERFLGADMQIVNTERLMPFGQGRRKCLGEQLARSCMFTFFAGIAQRFDIELPEKAGDEKYSLPERELLPGIVLSPKQYHVVFKQR